MFSSHFRSRSIIYAAEFEKMPSGGLEVPISILSLNQFLRGLVIAIILDTFLILFLIYPIQSSFDPYIDSRDGQYGKSNTSF